MAKTLPPNPQAAEYARALGLDPDEISASGFVVNVTGARNPKTGAQIFHVEYEEAVYESGDFKGFRAKHMTTEVAPPWTAAAAPTLTGFLFERIAEDEAVARAASIGSESWRLGEFDETVLWWPPSSPEKIAWNREHFGDEAAAAHARWGGQTIESSGDKIAPHIARHDPARVLAECGAKRRLVALHERAIWFQPSSPLIDRATGRPITEEGTHPGGCIVCAGDDSSASWPCDTLRVLASVYADHADYRDEWKP